ncbi:MAG: S9 family peptidase [Saprospiraceae bacterium]|nr:S9 family peptidase [Candidatus Vicinibacter affinis]
MKIALLMFLSCITGLTLQAQKKKSGQPPLIDREIFFGDPEISGAQLSPNGKFMSFIKPYKGTRNIWVKKASEAFEAAKPVTADTLRPLGSYFWSRDSKYILYVQDKGGNENYHIYAVNPAEKLMEGMDVPTSRNLTNLSNVRAMIYSVPKSNPDLIYVGLNDRDASWHDLYEIRISNGEKKLLRKNEDRMVGWIFDHKDKLRLAMKSNPDGSTDLLRLDNNGFTKIYSSSILESYYPVNFHPDGQHIYMVTDVGDEINLSRLVLFNINTLKMSVIESDPEKRVDFGSASFSDITQNLIATFYEDDKTRIYWKDKKYESEYKLLKKQFKGMEISFDNSTKDEMTWLLSVYSDTDPGAKYLYDRRSKKVIFQYRPRPKMPVTDLSPMTVIRYKSSDGLEIPAYLTLPKGLNSKNLPLIVNPHGGPWARNSWGYDAYAQLWSNRGYAVLQPNFRGSTGYGKKFINAGNKQWGEKMQDDITYGVQYLIKKGIVDAKKVGILGGSYGGYATLAGVTFTPDIYACGVSIVGPSSLITLLQSIPPYWEAGRKVFHERMGDPTNPEGEAQLKKQSPLFSVDKIKVPLLVVQGANDPRVKKAESDQIVIAMRDKNLPVEYICAPDEGHGFARPVNNMAFIAAAEKFLAKHLGGRYQEDINPAVAKRLQEITVDVRTVTMPKKIDASQITSAVASKDLVPGDYTYLVDLEMMGQKMDFEEKINIKDEGKHWLVSSNLDMPTGSLKDFGKFQKGNLNQISRYIDQGPINMDLSYHENSISGKINMSGNKSELNIKIDNPVFADGPAPYLYIACLPLSNDYKTIIVNSDLQKMEQKLMSLEVVGSEMVNNVDCFKVEVKPANADPGLMTIWVAKTKEPKAVKYSITLPELGGAVMTGVLQ